MINGFGQILSATGLRFSFRPSTVDELVLENSYQRNRFAALGPDLGLTIVDVGAHIGAFSIEVAATHRNAAVHAIEPSCDNYQILAHNVWQNRLPNITLHNIALSDSDGVVTLHHAAENWGHSIFRVLAGNTGLRSVARSQTLSTFMANNHITKIDHLKMNAEGAEYQVILGTSTDVLKNVQSMMVEFHPLLTHCGEEIAEKLDRCGFEVNIHHSAQEHGKGWISARQPVDIHAER